MRISLNPNRSTGRPTSDPHQIAKNLKAPCGSFSDRLDFGKMPSWTTYPGSLFPHFRSIRFHETPEPAIRAMVEQPEQPGNDGAVYRTIPQLRNDPR